MNEAIVVAIVIGSLVMGGVTGWLWASRARSAYELRQAQQEAVGLRQELATLCRRQQAAACLLREELHTADREKPTVTPDVARQLLIILGDP